MREYREWVVRQASEHGSLRQRFPPAFGLSPAADTNTTTTNTTAPSPSPPSSSDGNAPAAFDAAAAAAAPETPTTAATRWTAAVLAQFDGVAARLEREDMVRKGVIKRVRGAEEGEEGAGEAEGEGEGGEEKAEKTTRA